MMEPHLQPVASLPSALLDDEFALSQRELKKVVKHYLPGHRFPSHLLPIVLEGARDYVKGVILDSGNEVNERHKLRAAQGEPPPRMKKVLSKDVRSALNKNRAQER